MSNDGAGWRTGPPEDQTDDVSDVNSFTEELSNVDASEWDVDTAVLWGDEVDQPGFEAAPLGLDLLF